MRCFVRATSPHRVIAPGPPWRQNGLDMKLRYRISRARLGGVNAGVDLDASVPRFLEAVRAALEAAEPGLELDLAEGPDACEIVGAPGEASPEEKEALADRCRNIADAMRKCGDWLVYYGAPAEPNQREDSHR